MVAASTFVVVLLMGGWHQAGMLVATMLDPAGFVSGVLNDGCGYGFQ